MVNSKTIRKTDGSAENFFPEKIGNSIKKSCLAVNSSLGEAERYAELITREVNRWLRSKSEVTSTDLRVRSGKELKKYHPEAAFFYENYKKTI